MINQLALAIRLDKTVGLADYVGEAGAHLSQLHGVIYLSGQSGSGKSHLLQGLCHPVIKAGGSAIFLPLSEDIDADVVEGLQNYDLVCLDDVDSILEIRDWQVSLFQLINSVKDCGGKIVLAATRSIHQIHVPLKDLDSRLRAAYLISTDRLSDQQKLSVIKGKAKKRGFEMSEEVCRFILQRSPRDMHHLAALVEQLDTETLRHQKRVTIPFVKEALGL